MKKFNVKLLFNSGTIYLKVANITVEEEEIEEVEKMDILDLLESYILENENNHEVTLYSYEEIKNLGYKEEEIFENFLPINGGEFYSDMIHRIEITEIKK